MQGHLPCSEGTHLAEMNTDDVFVIRTPGGGGYGRCRPGGR